MFVRMMGYPIDWDLITDINDKAMTDQEREILKKKLDDIIHQAVCEVYEIPESCRSLSTKDILEAQRKFMFIKIKR